MQSSEVVKAIKKVLKALEEMGNYRAECYNCKLLISPNNFIENLLWDCRGRPHCPRCASSEIEIY